MKKFIFDKFLENNGFFFNNRGQLRLNLEKELKFSDFTELQQKEIKNIIRKLRNSYRDFLINIKK